MGNRTNEMNTEAASCLQSATATQQGGQVQSRSFPAGAQSTATKNANRTTGSRYGRGYSSKSGGRF